MTHWGGLVVSGRRRARTGAAGALRLPSEEVWERLCSRRMLDVVNVADE